MPVEEVAFVVGASVQDQAKGPGFGSGDARQGKSVCGFMLGGRDTWDGVG